MKPLALLRGLSAFVLVAGSALSACAASFSAELLDVRDGQTQVGACYVQDKSYRLEMIESGQPVIVLYDGPSGITRIVNVAEKSYVEAGPESPLGRMASPFGFYAHFAAASDVKVEGTETIAGFACARQVLSKNGQLYCTAWYAAELGMPVKIEIPLFGQTMELRAIQPGAQDPSRFAVPEGYTQAPDPTLEPVPAWAGDIAASPLLDPPFERTLSEGQIIRLHLAPGRTVRIRWTNAHQEPGAFTSVGFKGGRPTSSVSGNTMNLESGQEASGEVTAKPGEVDDYVIRVGKGRITLVATVDGMETGAALQSAPPEAEIRAPESVGMASRFEVAWSGPAANNDFICVSLPEHPPGRHATRAGIREGNPLKLWAPNVPGTYEVRYVQGTGSKVLASMPITVEPATAEVRAGSSAKAADWIEVAWDGPAIDGDCIIVARPDQPDGASVERVAVRQGNPVRVRAPCDPGNYEVRYFLARATKVLARLPVTIEPVSATVQPPATIKAGSEFDVAWTGPGYGEDRIVIAREAQAPASHVASMRVRPGAPARLRAPKETGVYEVRYILGRGPRLLAKVSVTVEAP